jgi:crotonobetainyl-CoA:carnitine CoA-transferase CaiB-like acyl-CoA transferase
MTQGDLNDHDSRCLGQLARKRLKVFDDPQVKARGMEIEMPHPLVPQPIHLIGSPMMFPKRRSITGTRRRDLASTPTRC